jgi:homoserine dehydrogenase
MNKKKEINIAIVGFGKVGTGLVKLLQDKQIEGIKIKRIVDKDLKRPRDVKIDESILTDNLNGLYEEDIDIVVELIGGYEPARSIILTAMRKDKSVVTANKAVLSQYWSDIIGTALDCKVGLGIEASVACGIPILSLISQGLIGDDIQEIFGIINGTCNYILTRMQKQGVEFEVALEEAKNIGYAEQDPSLDIQGIDTSHKLSILSSLAFGLPCEVNKIYTEGITHISYKDIIYADELDYKIKLLGIAKKQGDKFQVRVHPTLLPKDHILAQVDDVYNAIYLHTQGRKKLLFYGQGAGRYAAASAVLSDLLNLANQIREDKLISLNVSIKGKMEIEDINNLTSCYYLRFTVLDKPGVLAAISSILGEYNISIASVIQKERGDIVPVVMLTHNAKEANMQKALSKIDNLEVTKAKTVLIRLEELN